MRRRIERNNPLQSRFNRDYGKAKGAKIMKVMKFGGTSIGDGQCILHVAQIVKQYRENERLVVVVSAMRGVTDRLYQICKNYKSGAVNDAFADLNKLYESHKQALNSFRLNGRYKRSDQELMQLFGQLIVFLTLQKEYSSWGCDYVVSYGERFSSFLLSKALQRQGVAAKYVESSQFIVTNDEFGNARVLMEETKQKVEKHLFPLLIKGIVPVVTGFFGATIDGKVAVLGRGGSDYSATILAYALDAQEVILWKEVDGVYTIDPKKGNGGRLLTELSYKEASDLAKNGAKVLHPAAMEPVISKNIVVWVKNTFKPDLPGSKIWRGSL